VIHSLIIERLILAISGKDIFWFIS
jgi:hypothetical protein